MKRFSKTERQKYWQDLDNEVYDLVIIGGGITGAGVARDAASRGMKVIVLEAQDFAGGTSSRSSKLIHGGIRYLENFEFKLVFEALNERTRLFEMAPHLVHPLRFMIPLYRDSRVGMGKMGMGMWLYDALALFQAPEMHERLDAKESTSRIPILKPESLLGSYVYSDAYMDDDRLVHETLRSAHEFGARALNYVEVKAADFQDNGAIEALTVEDRWTGEKKKVRGKHFCGSVGPWTDILGHQLFPRWKKLLRPTKGIHITISKERLPLDCAVVMAAEKSQRIVFGIPRHDMVIIGTTDTDYDGDPSQVSVTAEDVRYLLGVVESYFPGAQLKPEDILAAYAGVRPLVNDGAENEGKTSREHLIWSLGRRNMTIVAGGKYTTYRKMAQEIVEKILDYFPVEDRAHLGRPRTEEPLNSDVRIDIYDQAVNQASVFAKEFKRPLREVESLCLRYGAEATKILERNPSSFSYWQLESAQAIDFTMCTTLVDFYSRRVPLFLSRADHGLSFLDEVVAVFAEKLGWDSKKVGDERQSLANYMAKELAWKNAMGSKYPH